MQYLYYGGPESLLIKNNEVMEVRNLPCHRGGAGGGGTPPPTQVTAHVNGRSGGPMLGLRLDTGFGALPTP